MGKVMVFTDAWETKFYDNALYEVKRSLRPPRLLIPDDEAVAGLLYKLLKVYIAETLYMHDHCI